MLDQTLTWPEDPEQKRSFTARLLAEVKAQAILIEKLRHQLRGTGHTGSGPRPKRRNSSSWRWRPARSPPGANACADCGGRLRRIGEDVTEELEYVPGRFIVNCIVRARLICSCCERFVQAPLPSRPIGRGRPGPGLLAHVLVSKYANHLPL